MPQLDITSFTSQIVWLVAIYLIFYLLLVQRVLPRIGRILKLRTAAPAGAGQQAGERSPTLSGRPGSLLVAFLHQQQEAAEASQRSAARMEAAERSVAGLDALVRTQRDLQRQRLESLSIKRQLLDRGPSIFA